MKRTRFAVISGVTALGLSLFPAAANAAAPAADGLALSLGDVPASATRVLIGMESPLNITGGPKKIEIYQLADVSVTGASMTVVVPSSRLLRSVAVAQHGIVNLMLTAVSATRSYSMFAPA